MIPKPGKPTDEIMSYRPITLLLLLPKVFENVLIKTIQVIPENRLVIQCGFRNKIKYIYIYLYIYRILNKIKTLNLHLLKVTPRLKTQLAKNIYTKIKLLGQQFSKLYDQKQASVIFQ